MFNPVLSAEGEYENQELMRFSQGFVRYVFCRSVFSSLCRKMGSKGFHHQAAASLANDVDVDMRLIKKWPMNINRFKVQCFNTQSFIVSNKSFLPFLGVPSIESMLYPDK